MPLSHVTPSSWTPRACPSCHQERGKRLLGKPGYAHRKCLTPQGKQDLASQSKTQLGRQRATRTFPDFMALRPQSRERLLAWRLQIIKNITVASGQGACEAQRGWPCCGPRTSPWAFATPHPSPEPLAHVKSSLGDQGLPSSSSFLPRFLLSPASSLIHLFIQLLLVEHLPY